MLQQEFRRHSGNSPQLTEQIVGSVKVTSRILRSRVITITQAYYARTLTTSPWLDGVQFVSKFTTRNPAGSAPKAMLCTGMNDDYWV